MTFAIFYFPAPLLRVLFTLMGSFRACLPSNVFVGGHGIYFLIRYSLFDIRYSFPLPGLRHHPANSVEFLLYSMTIIRFLPQC